MKPLISAEGVDWGTPLATGEQAGFAFREVRRERTGIHAQVAVMLDAIVLSHDTFNVGRSEDRRRLAKAAHGMLDNDRKVAWPLDVMGHQLDVAALQTPRLWEETRIEITSYAPEDEPAPLAFIVRPYLIQGGGTIFFAPPGSGKSYLLQAMSICITRGVGTLWPVLTAYPVLYVNLERDGASMHRRERALLHALRLSGRSEVSYLHARGMSLEAIKRKARAWVQVEGGGVMLDSLSRGGMGNLNDNEVGNAFVDAMNGLGALWWGAIGHAPRQSADHLYGSVHFDAGADIEVKVASQSRETSVGMALTITKANDIGKFQPQYLALDFTAPDAPLTGIRAARPYEFPDLTIGAGLSEEERMKHALLDTADGTLSVGDIVERSGISYSNVSTRLKNSSMFRLVRKEGKRAIYGLSEASNGHFSGEVSEK